MATKFGHHGLKGTADLPNGITLGLTVTGEVVSIDKDGKRTTLDNPDAVKSLWYGVSDTWPETPRIPYDPALAAQGAKARASIAAGRQQGVTASKNLDGSIRLTLDDGTVATVPAA